MDSGNSGGPTVDSSRLATGLDFKLSSRSPLRTHADTVGMMRLTHRRPLLTGFPGSGRRAAAHTLQRWRVIREIDRRTLKAA